MKPYLSQWTEKELWDIPELDVKIHKQTVGIIKTIADFGK